MQHLLVLDKTPFLAKLIALMLHNQEWELHPIGDPEELAPFPKEHFEAILIDEKSCRKKPLSSYLPTLEFYLKKGGKIIYTTIREDSGVLSHENCSSIVTLRKPFSPEELLALLRVQENKSAVGKEPPADIVKTIRDVVEDVASDLVRTEIEKILSKQLR